MQKKRMYKDGGDVDPVEPPQQDRLSGIDDPITRGGQEAILNIAAKSQALARLLGEGSNALPVNQAPPDGNRQLPPPREIEGMLIPAGPTNPTQPMNQGSDDNSKPGMPQSRPS